jgi:Protein of unknown function (DUF2934)
MELSLHNRIRQRAHELWNAGGRLDGQAELAWLTLKCNGIEKVRANELARCILHLATEGERDPVRLQPHRARW